MLICELKRPISKREILIRFGVSTTSLQNRVLNGNIDESVNRDLSISYSRC